MEAVQTSAILKSPCFHQCLCRRSRDERYQCLSKITVAAGGYDTRRVVCVVLNGRWQRSQELDPGLREELRDLNETDICIATDNGVKQRFAGQQPDLGSHQRGDSKTLHQPGHIYSAWRPGRRIEIGNRPGFYQRAFECFNRAYVRLRRTLRHKRSITEFRDIDPGIRCKLPLLL